MAIGLENFEPETFAQANPFLTGLSNAYQTMNQGAQAQQQQVAANYAQPLAQANLANAQLQPGLTQAQTAQAQGAGAQGQAQAGLLRAQTPYAGYQAMGQYYSGLGRILGSAANPYIQFMQQMSTPKGEAQMAVDPGLAQKYAQITQMLSQGSFGPGLPNIPNMMIGNPGAMPQNGSSAPQMPQAPQTGAPAGGVPLQPASTVPQISGSQGWQQQSPVAAGAADAAQLSPDAQAAQNIAQNNTNSALRTGKQQDQITFDNSVSKMMDMIAPAFKQASNYSGLVGSAEYKGAQIMSGVFGHDTPDYFAVQYLKGAVPQMTSDLLRAFGSHMTNSQREEANELTNVHEWDVDPQGQMEKWKGFVDSVHANTAAITQTKAQNLQQMKQSVTQQVGAAAQNQNNGLALSATQIQQLKNAQNLPQFRKVFGALSPQQRLAYAKQRGWTQ